MSQAFARRGYVPVAGTLNDVTIRATLVPIGDGKHHLYINGDMRKRAGVDIGERINLLLEIDTEPRVIPMPEELAKALRANKEAKTAFEELPPSHQRDILV